MINHVRGSIPVRTVRTYVELRANSVDVKIPRARYCKIGLGQTVGLLLKAMGIHHTLSVIFLSLIV